MGDEAPDFGQVWLGLNGTPADEGLFPIIGSVSTLSTAAFSPKVTIGDYTKDADDYISTLIISDLTGGMNVEDMNEGSDTNRCWTAFADIRKPGKIAHNSRVEQLEKPEGATGTAYSCAQILNTPYTIFGGKIHGRKESDGTWYAGVNFTLTPVGKPVAYQNKIFVPCGSGGYAIVHEADSTTNPGVPTVTNVTTGIIPYPSSYDKDAPDQNPPTAIAFTIFDQKLWALTTGGAMAWSFTGADDTWNWPYDEARAWYPHIESGRVPKRIIPFPNPEGTAKIYATSNRDASIYEQSSPSSLHSTPIQVAPHPDNGGAVAVWRAGEDLYIGNGLDIIRYTSAGVVVPMAGLARDDGMPNELWGRITDLEPETSELLALVGPTPGGGSGVAYGAKFGSDGSGDSNFANPTQMALHSGGDLYIADTGNDRVKRHEDDGTFVSEITGLTGATGIALDSSNAVFVTDGTNHKVLKYVSGSLDDEIDGRVPTYAWEYDSKFGTDGSGDDNFANPNQIATDGSGNIYVADTANNRLKKHQADGTYISAITGLTGITGVTVDSSDSIYVTYFTGSNPWLRKYNSAHVQQWDVQLLTGGSSPHVTTDGTHVYAVRVVSGLHGVMKRLCSTGAFAVAWGTTGTGDGQFTDPVGIAYDGTHLYVVDQGNHRIQKFTTSGTFVAKWGTSGSGDGQFTTPTGIAVNPITGNLLVTDSGRDDVQEFTNTGTFVRKFSSLGSGDGQVDNPTGIVVTADGTGVYVADTGNDRITKFAETPTYGPGTANGKFNTPLSLGIKQSSGRLYVSDSANKRVQYFTSALAYEGKWGAAGTGNGQFGTVGPGHLAVNQSSGDVYVLDPSNYRVQRFNATGTFTAAWGSNGTGDGQFSVPSGIGINPVNGNVLVTDTGRDDIQEFTSSGSFVRRYASLGSANGQVNNPTGIVVEPDGDTVFVADQGNDRIQRFDYFTGGLSGQTYPGLYAWTGVGWYGKWRGNTLGVNPNWLHVTATDREYRAYWGMDDGYCYSTKLARFFENPRRALIAGEREFAPTMEIITSKFDAAMLGNWKIASHMVVFMDHASADEYITIEYMTDAESGWQPLGTVNSTTKTYLPFGLDDGFSEGVKFNWIQFRIRGFSLDSIYKCPIIKSIVLAFIKIPQNSDAFQFVVAFPNEGYMERSANAIRAALNDLIDAKEMVKLRLHEWDGDQREFRGYLTASSGEDAASDLAGGSRAINFIALRSSE